jgi:homocysteine S-methyltransferase
VHCTTRDHNRLGAWSVLCGAKALGINTVLVATGDFVALGDRASTTTVRDVDVYELVQMARGIGLQVGVVFDPGATWDAFDRQVDRLARKLEAGAQFAVTQPVYEEATVERLLHSLARVEMPILLGILPLWSARHAQYLHERVSGIAVGEAVRRRMDEASDPVLEGVRNGAQMLRAARRLAAGACVMPPFGHYEVVAQLLAEESRAA